MIDVFAGVPCKISCKLQGKHLAGVRKHSKVNGLCDMCYSFG